MQDDPQEQQLAILASTHNMTLRLIKSSGQANQRQDITQTLGSVAAAIARTPKLFSNQIKHISRVTRNIAKRVLSPSFWEMQPPLDDFRYKYERSPSDLKQEVKIQAAQDLFVTQAVEIAVARNFQIKRALAVSTLATALCAGLAYLTLGSNEQTSCAGTCASITAGILSWLYFGNCASIREIALRKKARILQLTALHISPQETDEACKRITGGKLFNGLRIYGFFGLQSIRTMQDAVAHNFSLTTHVRNMYTSAPTDLR
jgi:hypothetical protein